MFWVVLGLLAGLVAAALLGRFQARKSLPTTGARAKNVARGASPVSPESGSSPADTQDLPGVDLSGLPEESRRALMTFAQAHACTCGCGKQLGPCRRDRVENCEVSLNVLLGMRDRLLARPDPVRITPDPARAH